MLVVAGDVDHKKVFPMVEKIYGDWKASEFDPFEKWPIPEFEPLAGDSKYITVNENTRVPIVMMGWHGPDTRNDVTSTYAADLFLYILAQKTSKLQQDLVDSGLAYQVSLTYATNRYTGPIELTLVPNPAHIREAIEKVNEHIAQWNSDDYFSDEQLQTAKTLIAIDDARGKESTSEYVHTVTFWWAVADITYYTNYVENLSKVTREDIRNYVNRYIIGKPKVTGILLSPAMQEKLVYDAIGL
jgi:zinc protease